MSVENLANNMKITYYGVRGSIAVSGKQFDEFGGHTTCVQVEYNNTLLLIDAGTGIRNAGNAILARAKENPNRKIHLLFTHTHWDHIQGFPFFVPAYLPNYHLLIYGETKSSPGNPDPADSGKTKDVWTIARTLSQQQFFMFFPVSVHSMSSKMEFFELMPGRELKIDDIVIHSISMSHPNSTLGFRLEAGGKSFVFCTDVEHNPDMTQRLAKFGRNADIFAYDCQYTPEEYENGKQGWGHSTYEAAIEISRKAQVKNLHMIHHDPSHSDEIILQMEKLAQALFPATHAVREGDTFTL